MIFVYYYIERNLISLLDDLAVTTNITSRVQIVAIFADSITVTHFRWTRPHDNKIR